MRPLAGKLLVACAALIGFAVLATAASAAVAGGGRSAGSLLYVQQTGSASLERLGHGTYRLRLTGVSPRVATFTDRPHRRAGSQRLERFLASWGANGFAGDPPNAALVLDHAPTARDVALLTLSHPHYDRARQTLTYRATPLRGRDPALASFGRRADPVTAGRLGAASLFIDDGGGASTEVTFSIQSAVATSSSVRFLVDGGAWSLSSVGTLAIVGTPSVSSIYATRGALSIGLPAAEPLNMEVSVPLEQEGAEAPSVEVTNVVGTITVTWTTTTGLQTQTLLAGDPLVLYGLAP
ncbi:MAG: hypothetical protein U0R71_08615 [Solirubrobacterales bacterium]